MPHLVHMALTREAVVDKTTNAVSLHGLIEEVRVPTEAFVRSTAGQQNAITGDVTLYALISWEWPKKEQPEPIELKIRLTSPANATTTLGKLPVDFKAAQRCRIVVKLPPLRIDDSGIYTVELVAPGATIGQVPLSILAMPDESAAN